MQQFIELIQTHPDVVGLVIMAFCIVLFVTHKLPMAVTGCLGCLLMVLLGVCDFETAFSGFSDSIVLLMAGSMIVGISKPVIKAHGSSDARAVRGAIRQAINAVESNFCEDIRQNAASMTLTREASGDE